MFLDKKDLSDSLDYSIRDMLAKSSDPVILSHCQTAESVVESYLSRRYLIRPELEKTGGNRNKLLLSVARDLAIYYLYNNSEQIPNIRVKNYDNAIKILDDFKAGDIMLPGVPAASGPEEGSPDANAISYGGRPPRAPLFR